MRLRGRWPQRCSVKFSVNKKNQRHTRQPHYDTHTGGESQRHADHDAAPRNGRESPEKRADECISGAEIETRTRKGDSDQCWVRNRDEDASDDCDASIKEEATSKPVTEKQECPNG